MTSSKFGTTPEPEPRVESAWLLRKGEVLASAEVADRLHARMVGLLGRSGCVGAIVLPDCRAVHTIGMRFNIDVAYCDADFKVLSIVAPMRSWRFGLPRPKAKYVVEAAAGSFDRWGVVVGDQLELKQ